MIHGRAPVAYDRFGHHERSEKSRFLLLTARTRIPRLLGITMALGSGVLFLL